MSSSKLGTSAYERGVRSTPREYARRRVSSETSYVCTPAKRKCASWPSRAITFRNVYVLYILICHFWISNLKFLRRPTGDPTHLYANHTVKFYNLFVLKSFYKKTSRILSSVLFRYVLCRTFLELVPRADVDNIRKRTAWNTTLVKSLVEVFAEISERIRITEQEQIFPRAPI